MNFCSHKLNQNPCIYSIQDKLYLYIRYVLFYIRPASVRPLTRPTGLPAPLPLCPVLPRLAPSFKSDIHMWEMYLGDTMSFLETGAFEILKSTWPVTQKYYLHNQPSLHNVGFISLF